MSKAKDEFYAFIEYLEDIEISPEERITNYVTELEEQNKEMLGRMIKMCKYLSKNEFNCIHSTSIIHKDLIRIIEKVTQKSINEVLGDE